MLRKSVCMYGAVGGSPDLRRTRTEESLWRDREGEEIQELPFAREQGRWWWENKIGAWAQIAEGEELV